jgi:CPA1 family monovalent cation:H+ antiporter
VWSTLLFWLNGLAFVLLGLQFRQILVAAGVHRSIPLLVVYAVAIAVVAMVTRIAWFFPGAYLPHLLSRKVRETEERPSWKTVLVGGWAGMRGAVTLAAALSIPLVLPGGEGFPGRDVVIFLAFGVIATTLFVQGTTTEWLIRKLGLREDGLFGREERLARTTAVDAGLKVLRALESSVSGPEEDSAVGVVVAEYEHRLAELGADGESRTHARIRRAAERRFRLAALEAERVAVDRLWRTNVITDEVHRPLQHLLDSEEAALKAQPARHDPPQAPL